MMNQSAICKNLLEKPFVLMGIVNVTPDSFFDGGKYNSTEKAVLHAEKLIRQGVDILDFGGASSRPGAQDISPEEESSRVIPAIKIIASQYKVPISIDTTWSDVAKEAFNAGASWINDVSAGRYDSKMANFVAQNECPVILQHSRKTSGTMQVDPKYGDVVTEVKQELLDAVKKFTDSGVKREQILLDPGIGFAKTVEHNISLLHAIEEIVEIGFPLVLGTSRKNFIGKITGKEVDYRLYGSLGSIVHAYFKGVKIFRVHDVEATKDFLEVLTVIDKSLPADYFVNSVNLKC